MMSGLHSSTTANGTMWSGSNSSFPKWLKVDLGNIQKIDHIQIFNLNWEGYTNRGSENVEIYYSDADSDPGNPVTDPRQWKQIGAAFDLEGAPGDPDYGYGRTVEPHRVDLGVRARWVLIQVNSNHGGSYGGLSEVQFFHP